MFVKCCKFTIYFRNHQKSIEVFSISLIFVRSFPDSFASFSFLLGEILLQCPADVAGGVGERSALSLLLLAIPVLVGEEGIDVGTHLVLYLAAELVGHLRVQSPANHQVDVYLVLVGIQLCFLLGRKLVVLALHEVEIHSVCPNAMVRVVGVGWLECEVNVALVVLVRLLHLLAGRDEQLLGDTRITRIVALGTQRTGDELGVHLQVAFRKEGMVEPIHLASAEMAERQVLVDVERVIPHVDAQVSAQHFQFDVEDGEVALSFAGEGHREELRKAGVTSLLWIGLEGNVDFLLCHVCQALTGTGMVGAAGLQFADGYLDMPHLLGVLLTGEDELLAALALLGDGGMDVGLAILQYAQHQLVLIERVIVERETLHEQLHDFRFLVGFHFLFWLLLFMLLKCMINNSRKGEWTRLNFNHKYNISELRFNR